MSVVPQGADSVQCGECSSPLPEGSRFCAQCGAPSQAAGTSQVPAGTPETVPATHSSLTGVRQFFDSRNRKAIAVIASIVIAIGIVAAVMLTSSKPDAFRDGYRAGRAMADNDFNAPVGPGPTPNQDCDSQNDQNGDHWHVPNNEDLNQWIQGCITGYGTGFNPS